MRQGWGTQEKSQTTVWKLPIKITPRFHADVKGQIFWPKLSAGNCIKMRNSVISMELLVCYQSYKCICHGGNPWAVLGSSMLLGYLKKKIPGFIHVKMVRHVVILKKKTELSGIVFRVNKACRRKHKK